MFTEAGSVALQQISSCAESREIQYLSCAVPLSGTGEGGLMEAYAILCWLSVDASLSYLPRGQLRDQLR